MCSVDLSNQVEPSVCLSTVCLSTVSCVVYFLPLGLGVLFTPTPWCTFSPKGGVLSPPTPWCTFSPKGGRLSSLRSDLLADPRPCPRGARGTPGRGSACRSERG